MKSKKEYESESKDDDKPARKNKSRLVFVTLVALAVVWGVFH